MLSVIALACGENHERAPGNESSSAGTPTSSGGAPAVAGQATSSAGLALGGAVTSGGSAGASGSGPLSPEDACATGTLVANLAGVNLLVMFDRSNSMNDPANDAGDSRWQVATRALTGFFADPKAAGLHVALRFFPHDKPAAGCNQDGCNVAACAQPLVELGTLSADAAPSDAHEQALLDATNATLPPPELGEGTPISAALDGALHWAAAQRQMTPNETSAVVLVTDGEASGCDVEPEIIAGLASSAFATNGTRTYAVGLTGAVEDDLNAIAQAGGTERAIFVEDGADAQQALLDALSAIRGSVLDCDLPMPVAEAGMKVDPTLVNVNLTTSAGLKTTLTQLPSEAACGALAGWHYDDASAPTRIVLCPATCNAVSNDPAAMLQILLGCSTVTDVPH